ncbi:MAG: hypothetical protein HYZ54_06715 [Ignavibacteriae bacterium]|nr:hypothetical protein [Ignavibacteriota bacterium]
MTPTNTQQSKKVFRIDLNNSNLPYLVVTGIFIISRIIFAIVGVSYDSNYSTDAWQAIDPAMLLSQPFESIWYLHTQPPILNALIGAILHISPNHLGQICHSVFFIGGCGMSLALCALLQRIGASPIFAIIITSLFIISPSSILYENYLFYTHPTTVILCVAAYFLYKFIETKRTLWGLCFFFLCSLGVLTRSLLHVGWFAIIILLLLICARPIGIRKILLTSLIPFLICFGWYAKNAAIFGSFTASTWMGLNATHATVNLLTPEERSSLIADGTLSPLANVLPPFRAFNEYPPEYATPAQMSTLSLPNAALLQQPFKSDGTPNYHYAGYIPISRQYWENSKNLIRAKPFFYMKQTTKSMGIFLLPSSRYFFLDNNREKIEPYTTIYSAVILGSRTDNFTTSNRSPFMLCWWYIISLVFSSLWWIARLITTRFNLILNMQSARTVMLLYAIFTIVYVFTVSSLIEHVENLRFSYMVSPLVIIVLSATYYNIKSKGLNSVFKRNRH